MQDYTKLRVWQQANALSVAVYNSTRDFPPDERYGLTSQLRRAVVSIQSNIAEGCGRGTRADTSRMFQIAIGSAAEVANLLSLSRDLGYLKHGDYERLAQKVTHIRRMLIKLLFRLRAHRPAY